MKPLTRYTLAIAALLAVALSANAQFNWKNALKKVADTAQNALATTKFEEKDMVGTWEYVSPAVSFQGEGTMQKLGGAAASTALEDKLAPYYKTLGLNKIKLIVKEDFTFELYYRAIKLTGNIEKSEDGSLLMFNFTAFNDTYIGTLLCMATKIGNQANFTFDSNKLLDIIKKVGSLSNNSSVKALGDIINQYDGLYIGARFKRNK